MPIGAAKSCLLVRLASQGARVPAPEWYFALVSQKGRTIAKFLMALLGSADRRCEISQNGNFRKLVTSNLTDCPAREFPLGAKPLGFAAKSLRVDFRKFVTLRVAKFRNGRKFPKRKFSQVRNPEPYGLPFEVISVRSETMGFRYKIPMGGFSQVRNPQGYKF